jgi:hypothetical protein
MSTEKSPSTLPPPQPFGAGLFSDDEEKQFIRTIPTKALEAETDLLLPLATSQQDVLEETEKGVEETLEEPRKRGRRRTRRWKRLHSPESVESASEAEAPESLAEPEVFEAVEESETADDLFGDVEEEASVEPMEQAGEEPPRRRRRRRRRSRRGERTPEDSAETGEDQTEDLEDEDLEEQQALEEEGDFESDIEEGEVAATRGRSRRRAPTSAREIDAEEGDELDELEVDRPAHRKIPTWEEAVGLVIANNMETRAKTPGGRRR